MKRSDRDPDDFLAGLVGPFTEELRQLDAEIAKRMPGSPRILWEEPMWGGTHQTILGSGDFSSPTAAGKPLNGS